MTTDKTEGLSARLRDGEIYRWRWLDAKRDADSGPYRSYHCRSQIAVVAGGRLFDTFWSSLADHEIDPSQVELTFLCDQSWPTIKEYQIPLYDASDIADTRHSNSSGAPIYLRPGAVKSATAILSEIEYRESTARSEISSAQHRLQWLGEARALVAAGKLDEVHL